MDENVKGTAEWVMWVLGVLVLIFIGVSSYAVTKADNAVPKDDYRVDQARVEKGLQCLNEKMDKVLDRLTR